MNLKIPPFSKSPTSNITEADRDRHSEALIANERTGPPATSLLLEIQDEAGVRRIPLTSSPLMFGASQRGSADVVICDRTVSARHCVLTLCNGGVLVKDLGSTNGTFVGGVRVQEAWGGEGITILIGHTLIVCMRAIDDDSDAALDAFDDNEPIGAPLPGVAGGSLAMCRVATQVRRLALLTAPVLISGETGVGKELIARALHTESHRNEGPFVALNVAALPRELVESELFGHERGAFTGAISRRIGAFTEAEGGTLFLDEIGELPVEAQPKLLRALDGYEVRRIGSTGNGRRADVRVVAATHVPLMQRVNNGLFRRDLYHRLEVFVVELPPLRERQGDVLPIATALLTQMESEVGFRDLTPAAVAQLTAHDWPGNVRELRNVLYRAADLTKSTGLIDAASITRALRRSSSDIPPSMVPGSSINLTADQAKDWLASHGGNVSAAARAAGIPRTTFRKALVRGGIVTGSDDDP